MYSIFQSIVLGIAQGAGEFLPISSTAHLILIPYFTGWPDPGLAFDVALHFGTLIAVIAFFWKDWINIFSSGFKNLRNNGFEGFKKDILFLLIVATIPAAFFGVLLEKQAESVFRSPIIIAFTLILFGIILYWADKNFRAGKDIKNITLKDSIFIGLAQAIAIIPGVSRSGATITAGLARNFNKISAARFSFLLSTPVIAGATLLEFKHLLQGGFQTYILVGILSSAISGFIAIKYLLKFLEKRGYAIFFWYRLILGIIILLVYFLR